MNTTSVPSRTLATLSLQPRGEHARGQGRFGSKLAAVSIATVSFLGVLASPAAAANVAGTVDVAAGETLRVRSQPNTTSSIVTNLADNSSVTIICKVTGPNVVGNVSTTTQWDKLSNGYVSHGFIRSTGTIDPCPTAPTPPPTTTAPQGRVTVAAGDTLKVRSTPSTSGTQVSTLASGAIITLTCSTTGTSVNGNATWYKVSNGYVSAAYVARTNTTALPVCAPPTTTPPPSTTAVRAEFINRANYWFKASNGQIAGVAGFGRSEFGTWVKEGPTGSATYRRDCSGLIAMAWNLGSGNQPSSGNLITSSLTTPVNVTDLQPGDILAANGHVTMFASWVNKSTWTYMAYDFGGGTNGTGTMEYKQYTLRNVSGDKALRGTTDTRQYYARRSVKTN